VVRERVKAVALNKGKIEKLPKLADATLQSWAYLGGDKMVGEEGECHVRQLITPRQGYKLVSMDYSQMEVRMLLYYLNTPEATALLNKPNVDFHSENAVIAYGIDKDHPDFSFYRQLVKTITFGVLYGMGEKKLAMTLQISRTKAREYKNNFIERMPGFKEFKTNVERAIERTGTVRNKYGRLYQINKNDAYKGINFLIQGTSAEVVTERFIECVEYLKDKPSRLLIQVHDELVFEVHDSEYHEVVHDLKDIMEQNSLGLTLQVDIEVANPSWAEKVEYDPQTIDTPSTNLLQFIE
jgi:DNA polymerase I-like protein with 3'-5' exonuclease and polymerase domains